MRPSTQLEHGLLDHVDRRQGEAELAYFTIACTPMVKQEMQIVGTVNHPMLSDSYDTIFSVVSRFWLGFEWVIVAKWRGEDEGLIKP